MLFTTAPLKMHSNICEQYYINQVSQHGGSNIFKGPYYQRGYGMRRVQYGSGLGGIFLCVLPHHWSKKQQKQLEKK